MTPDAFIEKWKAIELTERAAAQSHFNDLCAVLNEQTPTEADPTGEWYAFEKGATKTTGGEGWADVWKRGCFGWEYKGKRKDLNAAFAQLQRYAVALENPPLLVVSDMDRFQIHTNWTNTVSQVYEVTLDELRDPRKLRLLKWTFSGSEELKPNQTRQMLTEEAAAEFAALAQRLRDRGHGSQIVAHFINRLLFCMFAEWIGLLPNKMFGRMLEQAERAPQDFEELAADLFAAMRKGGRVGFERVDWFNGGLFDDDRALPLSKEDIRIVRQVAARDWADIDASIFGTLFERGLDPDKRSQLGAHYTDRDKIMMIIEPVITRPLLAEWANIKAEVANQFAAAEQARSRRPTTQRSARAVYVAARRAEEASVRAARAAYEGFIERLHRFRVLDPACGSGNFLYLALLALKDIEHRANLDAEAMGLHRLAAAVGPESLQGIEINPYAAELARVTVWIGEIQWMRRNGFDVGRNPILKPLDTIECRDAILNADGTEYQWPEADVIIGNPPYLGAKLMKRRLGREETLRLRCAFDGRLPGFTDLVCYWFEKARALIELGVTKRAGLVATNSIRKNTNLTVMRRIAETTRIFAAWPEEQWTIDGAAVDVSLVCFGDSGEAAALLDGEHVDTINPDLTAGLNLTLARPLPQNRNGAFLGIQKSGPFDVPGEVARTWVAEPVNPNGRSNAEVLKPYRNGDDITGRPRDAWFIDLPLGLSEAEAALFASPFRHLATTPDEDGRLVSELRAASGSTSNTYPWWQPWRPRPKMRSRIERLSRYIVTPEYAQHRVLFGFHIPYYPTKTSLLSLGRTI
jgi:hypothetical protein